MRQRRSHRRGQQMAEVIAIVALIGLTLAWATARLPQAITNHFVQNQTILASPL